MFAKLVVSLFLSLGAYAQTIYTAGDSTMAKGGGGSGTDGWAQYLGQYLSLLIYGRPTGNASADELLLIAIPVVNMAIAGRSARSYTDEGRFTALINTVKSGDFVLAYTGQIIEFGHNADKPVLDGLSGAGDVYSTTATVTETDQTPDNIWSGTSIGAGPRFVLYAQEVAATNSVTYVDHYDYVAQAYDKLGQTAVTAFYPIDHTHTLPAGATVVAQAFVRGLLCGTSTLKAKVNAAGMAVPMSAITDFAGPVGKLHPNTSQSLPNLVLAAMLSWFPQSPGASGSQNGELPLAAKSTGKRSEPHAAETLPHDQILAKLFEQNASAEDGFKGPIPRPSILDNNAIYDPFDGSFLGSLVAPDHNVQPEEHGKLNDIAKNEELWSHLSRVLELQNQISRMHLDLEGIGINAADSKGKGKGTRSRATSVTRVIIDDVVEGEEGIGGKRDEEAERNKAREEEFLNLSAQFRGKREAINGIMTKLDSLSRAVTEFHALQAPKIDFPSSRNNSLPVTSTTAEPVTSPVFGRHVDPASTLASSPEPPTVLKRVDEPGSPQQMVDSPISTLISLPS
ncbi:SGNH hydrolase-type esterase domain-containing protein [Mycena latifolia]|nr:SGNH hydrolase-type esterase domain-containing protein [Mycena latifolia]